MTASRLGTLESRHRGRLAEILAATRFFSTEEVRVALELFDETFGAVGGGRWEVGADSEPSPPSHLPPPTSAYEFFGTFDTADNLLGYACYGPTPGTNGTFDLYWLAVHPAAQGAGEGSRLLGEVERRLRARAGRLLIVETSSRDAYEPTRRFYGSRGYREAARISDFFAPADDRVIYAKRLTPRTTSADKPSSAH
ncbi:MAG: GNAT family N-acetyltransferase [Gemmatimonadaceae bacterium]